MTMPRLVFLGLTALAALAAVRAAVADPRRILTPPDAGAPVASARLPELERATRQLRVGSASQHGALLVFWLTSNAPASTLTTETLEDARSSGALTITERAAPTVPELVVENRGKAHVLLLAGEILVGGKQNRVLREDILLPPRSGPRMIGVYCVEQGRWSEGRRDFESKSSFADPSLRRKVYDRVDQQSVWSGVQGTASGLVAASPTQSYQQVFEEPAVRERLGAAEHALDVKVAPDAVGAAVFVGATLSGVDVFNSPALFARQWTKLLRAHTVGAYAAASSPAVSEAKLRATLEALLAAVGTAPGSVRGNAGVGQIFEFGVERYRGAALSYEGRIVHVAIL
jgi:ARG and Rhodanese-Phosphatase-superfamily-associated Protein domain